MRVFLALAIAVAVFAGGTYSVFRSVEHPVANGNYAAHTTGSASRVDRIDWSDGMKASFDE